MSRWLLLAVAVAAVAGCVERDGGAKKIDPAYVAANLLTEAPAIQNRIDADLGGAVVYLGNDVDTRVLVPGGKVQVVHYWRVVDPPGDDWRVFAHLVGHGDDWINADPSDMRAGHPPGKWKAGQIIRDEQTITIGRGWKSAQAELVIGLYRKGSSDPSGRMPVLSGPKDDEERIKAFRFDVDLQRAATRGAMQYKLHHATGPIAIDGLASEPTWSDAPRSPAFTDAEGGTPVDQPTYARLLWDEQFLYAFIEVEDSDVFSEFSNRDDTLWKADVVELFIDADRNRRGYVELQVNPNNAVFDAFFPVTRAQKHHFEWNSKLEAKVVVHGTAGDRDDIDRGWNVEIAIPLADVKGMDAAMAVTIPPQPNDRWRLNVIRVDRPLGKSISASSWSPITIQDFHALGRMLEVVFVAAPAR